MDLSYLQKWLETPGEGNNFLKNTFAERETWHKPDLISICVNEVMKDKQMDALTKWIHDMLPWFHERFGCRLMVVLPSNLSTPTISLPSKLTRRQKPTPADEERGIGEVWRYNSNRIARAISMTSTMLAALWPIAAIFVLNLIPRFTVCLVVAVMFTLFFALTVNIIASPTRIQLFAATTAYVPKPFFLVSPSTKTISADILRYAAVLMTSSRF
jgi:hypothetical protein